MWLSDTQKIGVGLLGFGIFFTVMGVMMLFDRGLLAIGNLLSVGGLGTILGPQRVSHMLARRDKLRGTLCFTCGILLILIKYPFFGLILEFIGGIQLFGDWLPTAFRFLCRLPVIGYVVQQLLPRRQ
ncbi:vesicle transport protein [Radiomyces spectabilis]|uniref:vesicle transport protein n=1 Tax=Radiomyces spectabilis TaxID=64574 RepID=UPI00221F7D24|nr:vesicle transport protein [Radiomyces spectabilis]KAI8370361.1 vesicle transport protein [Radiomyces spectabilis]